MSRAKRQCGNCSTLGHNVNTCDCPGVRTPRSVRSEAYAIEHADEAQERTAAWKAANPTAQREWLTENPEKTAFFEARKDADRVRENARERYAINPEPKLERARAWAKNNPDTLRKNALARRYGITPEHHEQILEFQDRCCPVCDDPDPEATDHNHETEQVRGVLCSGCNLLLGRLGDTADAVACSALALLHYLANSGDHVSLEVSAELERAACAARLARGV